MTQSIPKRRQVLAALAAVLLPATAHPQEPRRIGVIVSAPSIQELQGPLPADPYARAFVEELVSRGWRPGQDLQLIWRSVELKGERIPALVDEMAKLPVDVILGSHNGIARQAKKFAPKMPVVIAASYHPDDYGVVTSLAKPGGMITGALLEPGRGINAKRVALLKEAIPNLSRMAYLSFSDFGKDVHDEMQGVARAHAVTILALDVDALGGFDKAFEEASRQKVQALMVGTSQIYLREATQKALHALALKHRMPVLHCFLAPGENGGLFAYANDLRDNYRIAARQVDRILRGARPGDIPMEQPPRYLFTIDKRAARAIGLAIPPSLLTQADRVFE